jgi:hypothetical protein
MPTYDVSVYCKECGLDHPVLLRVYVEDGPERKQSIAELFQGRSLPPQVAAIRCRNALCYKTGKQFHFQNDNEIFLVPPSHFRRQFTTR